MHVAMYTGSKPMAILWAIRQSTIEFFGFNTACFRRLKTVSLHKRKGPSARMAFILAPYRSDLPSYGEKLPRYSERLPLAPEKFALS